jgi:hypothetical protein
MKMMKIEMPETAQGKMRNVCKLFTPYFEDFEKYNKMIVQFWIHYWRVSRVKVRGLLADTVVRLELYDRWRMERTVRPSVLC